jgi:hypothetical protein
VGLLGRQRPVTSPVSAKDPGRAVLPIWALVHKTPDFCLFGVSLCTGHGWIFLCESGSFSLAGELNHRGCSHMATASCDLHLCLCPCVSLCAHAQHAVPFICSVLAEFRKFTFVVSAAFSLSLTQFPWPCPTGEGH